jgi:CHAD domain-containing protein
MAYCFEDHESIGDALARIADEELAAAATLLADRGGRDPDAAIHETRKGIKRMRTLLRLYRFALDKKVVRRNNVRLRDAGRTLSGARDRRVLADTLHGLAEAEPRLGGAVARALTLPTTRSGDGDVAAAISAAAAQLAKVRAGLSRWRPGPRGWKGIERGLRRIHRRAGRAGALAFAATPADSDLLHEFRKRVKDHWHVLQLLGGSWPALLTIEAAEVKRLSDLLGEDHDLALLIAVLTTGRRFEGRAALTRAAEGRSGELRTQARSLASRLYAETPAARRDSASTGLPGGKRRSRGRFRPRESGVSAQTVRPLAPPQRFVGGGQPHPPIAPALVLIAAHPGRAGAPEHLERQRRKHVDEEPHGVVVEPATVAVGEQVRDGAAAQHPFGEVRGARPVRQSGGKQHGGGRHALALAQRR